MTAPAFVTIGEAARARGLSTRQVRWMLSAGNLVAHPSDRDLVHTVSVVGSLLPLRGAARFTEESRYSKEAPVKRLPRPSRARPSLEALGPFVSKTDVSIAATCSKSCQFKVGGRDVLAGLAKFSVKRLDDDAAMDCTAEQVVAEEVQLIDRAFRGGPIPQDGARGGRDLRFHVGGEVGSNTGAYMLASAPHRLAQRSGGVPWTHTQAWREIPSDAWGSVTSLLASVERAEDLEIARTAGRAAAITVTEFPSDRAFAAFAFAVHGRSARQARAQLVRLRHGLGEFDASRGDNSVEKRQRGGSP